MQVIEGSEDHPTAAELYDRVRQLLPGIGLATVYRNLSALVEEGWVREVRAGGSTQYDRRRDRHDHVVCSRCGKLADVVLSLPHGALEEAERVTGYRITEHHVELLGVCADCRRPKLLRAAEGRLQGAVHDSR